MRLAIENHKDWRTEELLDILRRAGSCANRRLYRYRQQHRPAGGSAGRRRSLRSMGLSTHLKDMGVEEYADGFLLAEVPLGTGFLDLPKITEILRHARPEIRFNLEMITRDPLRIPCLTKKYWATFTNLPARHLAETCFAWYGHTQRKNRCRGSAV